MRSFLLFAGLAMAAAPPAVATTFGEHVAWCAPVDKGGNPVLCEGYLDSELHLLSSPDPMINGGYRACVPASEDRGRIIKLMQDYARQNPASKTMSGLDGLGLALKDHFPCR
jgi:hypothetical protein